MNKAYFTGRINQITNYFDQINQNVDIERKFHQELTDFNQNLVFVLDLKTFKFQNWFIERLKQNCDNNTKMTSSISEF